MSSTVSVVVQTHWDREWYLPHQTFIARLLHVMDKICGQLESGQLQSFLFDGQTAAMEDLMAHAEPALAARVQKLVREQRIVLGPWYVMADQFLSSGESLLRNLEIGIGDAEALGSCQRVGYLPDTFGHISQMPQLLHSFGIDNAVMWRGVDIPQAEFDWHSPDGSVAHSLFLTQGYYQHPFNVPAWEQALNTYLEQIASRSVSGELLLTQGGDHLASVDGLADRIAAFNANQSAYQLKQDTLAGHVAAAIAASTGRRVAVHGELRQNAQAFVLPDVLSTRRYLKRLNQQAEDRLAGMIEPLYAQLQLNDAYPAAYLESCWRTVIQQQAHDSICGCSVDEVHSEMEQRYVQLNQRFDALVERASASAGLIALDAADDHADGPFGDDSRFTLFNPQPHQHSGWMEQSLFIKGDAAPALSIATAAGAPVDHVLLSVTSHQTLRSPLDDFPDMLKGHLYRVAIRCTLPGMGALACIASAGTAASSRMSAAPTSSAAIENDHLRISFDAGRLTWTDKRSGETHEHPLAFYSELDAGDSYNYAPPAKQQTTLQRTFTLQTAVHNAALQELTLAFEIMLPAKLNADRSGADKRMVCNTGTLRLRLWQDSDTVDCRLDWHNRATDQRTRLLLPLAQAVSHTGSDSAFSWEQRPVVLADYPSAPSRREMPVCVMPSQSAITAGSLAFCHRAMQEYEIVVLDGRQYLGVTLVRSVGWLSRRDLVTRGVGAGPDMYTPGAQCLGEDHFEFSFGRIDPQQDAATQALERARRLRHAPVLLRGHSERWLPALDMGNSALQFSALRRIGDNIELRVWNPTASGQRIAAAIGDSGNAAHWRRVHADGRPYAADAVIAPHAVATFRRPA